MSDTPGTVTRWTAPAANPSDDGGFVAYGDYLDLHERAATLGSEFRMTLDREADCMAKIAAQQAEIERLRGHAEAMHGWIDALLSAVECEEQDIGHRPILDIIAEGGPIFEAYRKDYPRKGKAK